jgi:hypothetical protein
VSNYFSTLPPAERAAMASVGGLSRVIRYGSNAAVAAARSGFLAKFDREVDPDGTLDPEQRARLSALALKCHMKKMALARTAKARKAIHTPQAQEATL